MFNKIKPTRIKISNIEFFLFIISMVFTPQYLPVDIRLPVYFFWGFVGIYRGGLLANITRYTKITMVVLLVLIIYSSTVALLNGSEQIYLFFRYLRALVAIVVISVYLNSIEINTEKLLKNIILVLLVHSIIIIVEIAYPTMKELLVPFAGVSRIFYPYRANGLVNGYDYAGLYTNLGLLLTLYIYILTRRNIYLFYGLVCMAATVFTSRLNIILMSIVLIIIFLKAVKEKARFLSVFLLLIFLLISSLGLLLWALTTDAIPVLRDFIFSRFYWGDQLYQTIRYTYSDNNIKTIVGEQFTLPDEMSLVFGSGIDGAVDPGYMQTIYSVGIIGTLIIVLYYVYQFFYIKYFNTGVQKFDGTYIVYATSIFLLVFNIVGNIKIWFFFSTSIFELTSILIIVYELSKIKYFNS